MKKIIFTLAVVCGAVWSSFAQTSSSTTSSSSSSSSPADHAQFSVGLDGASMAGGIRFTSKAAVGVSFKYEMPIATNTLFTVSAGYTNLLYTDIIKQLNGGTSKGASFIPVKVGIKYYITQGFFVEGQAGVSFSLKNTSNNFNSSFAWSPGVGYTFGNGIEMGVRYESWTTDRAINQAALRVAYRF